MVALYLSNRTILAAVGSGGRGSVSVQKLCRKTDENGCIVGGIVTDAEEFKRLLSAFWEENALPKKDVTLVVDSAQFISRAVDVPVMNEQKTREFLRLEFSSVERAADPIFSWQILTRDRKTKMDRVLATMVERTFIRSYVELFAAMGITLDAVIPALLGAVQVLGKLPQLHSGTALVQLMDEAYVTSVLFSDGVYTYSSKKRMFNEQDTPAYGAELAQTVSNMLQFVQAQRMEKALNAVYFCGAQKLESCVASIRAIEMEGAALDASPVIRLSGETEGCEFLCAAGGLLKADGVSVLAQYRAGIRQPASRGRIRNLALVLLGFTVLAGALLALLLSRQAKLRALNAYNTDADHLAQAAEYDSANAELNGKLAQYNAYLAAEKDIESYPVADSGLNAVLAECADGLANLDIISYDAETGILKFNATAAEVEKINQFVDLLRQRDSFESVSYTGYAWQEQEGQWLINVVCYLSESAGKGE